MTCKKRSKKVEEAYNFVKSIAEENGTILFVGTKKQAQDSVKEEAERCGMYYINQRWLGGTLTNFKTIENRINRLHELERWEEDGTFDVLPKKEVIILRKEKDRLEKFLGGIKHMKGLPSALFVIDLAKSGLPLPKLASWVFRSSVLSIQTAIRTKLTMSFRVTMMLFVR